MSFDPDIGEFVELQNENHRLREALEQTRQYRWHATYNAVLSSNSCSQPELETHPGSGITYGEQTHRAAVWHANRAHGELPK